MKLIDLAHEQIAYITGLEGDSNIVDRLEDMGLGIGRSIVLVRKAPFSGPIVVKAGTIFVALRQSEAQCINVSVHRPTKDQF